MEGGAKAVRCRYSEGNIPRVRRDRGTLPPHPIRLHASLSPWELLAEIAHSIHSLFNFLHGLFLSLVLSVPMYFVRAHVSLGFLSIDVLPL